MLIFLLKSILHSKVPLFHTNALTAVRHNTFKKGASPTAEEHYNVCIITLLSARPPDQQVSPCSRQASGG